MTPTDEMKPVLKCDICKEEKEDRDLLKCKDCNTVICQHCLLKNYHINSTEVIEVFTACPNPKCKGTNIVPI